MCPQWAGTDWPYQGEPSEPVTPEPEPTVESQVFEGSGDKILQFDSGPFTVKLTHSGSRNFIVRALEPDLEESDLLVNEIGPYEGTVLAPYDEYGGLKIEGDGSWTAEVTSTDALFASPLRGDISGTGDSVFYWAIGERSVVSINHRGDSNFVVRIYTADGRDLLVNEIGNYGGEQIMETGIVEITADGSWSLNLS